jgi:hypothetical protein
MEILPPALAIPARVLAILSAVLAHVTSSATNFKDFVTALGIVAAGVYFAFRAWFGFFNVNVSISVTAERRRGPQDGRDYLMANVAIEKGSNAALSLLHGAVRLVPQCAPDAETRERVLVLDLCRLETRLKNLAASEVAVIGWMPAKEKALFVSPGEKMHFACVDVVRADVPYLVEAVIVGKKRWRKPDALSAVVTGFTAQWRATAVSLPERDRERTCGSTERPND